MKITSFALFLPLGGVFGQPNKPFPLTAVRSYDGSDRADKLGEAETTLIRKAGLTRTTSYLDGLGEMDTTGPNPRLISNAIANQQGFDIPSKQGLSLLVAQWGQFLDHDIDLTEPIPTAGLAPITIPTDENDPFIAASCPAEMDFTRSEFVTDTSGTRQQMNLITSFIDGSNVYGSDEARAHELRTFSGGKLKTSEAGKMLPYNIGAFSNAGGTDKSLYLAGDIRANEQLALMAIHTLFVREHNRLAEAILASFPDENDENIYQLARKLVGAEMQKITYNEFLPALLGPMTPKLKDYNGYDDTVDPSISNEFSTAAFRFGHSLLNSQFPLADASDIFDHLELKDMFFDPSYYDQNPTRVDYILGGLYKTKAQEVDTKINNDVRQHLFGEPNSASVSCMDLAAFNIQRGRDHGLLSYNELREAYGLPKKTTFMEVTSDPDLALQLSSVYASVDQIDAWVGGLAEDRVDGAAVGELVGTILADQFGRLMHGDPFFYLNDPDLQMGQGLPGNVFNINSISLSEIIRENTIHKTVRGNIFFSKNS